MDEKNLLPGLQDRLELIRAHEALHEARRKIAKREEREEKLLRIITELAEMLLDEEDAE